MKFKITPQELAADLSFSEIDVDPKAIFIGFRDRWVITCQGHRLTPQGDWVAERSLHENNDLGRTVFRCHQEAMDTYTSYHSYHPGVAQ